MNNQPSDDNPEDNALAYAAISLCGNQTRGSAPQWHELAAWHKGTLEPARTAEVLSHVANDPDCFQQWLDLVEAESWIDEESLSESTLSNTAIDAASQTTEHSSTSSRRLGAASATSVFSKVRTLLAGIFQQPLPVYGGAFAAVMLAVLVAPLLNTGQALTLQQQMDRSLDTYIDSGIALGGSPPVERSTRNLGGLFDELSVNDVERRYIQSGMLQFSQRLNNESTNGQPTSDQWTNLLDEIPGDSVDCNQAIDATHCINVADEFTLLGQWALMNAAACHTLLSEDSQVVSAGFWSEQYKLYQSLIEQPGIAQSQVLSQQLTKLPVQSPQALCTMATAVISASQ